MFTASSGGGIEKPTGVWEDYILGDDWPESSSIAALKATVDEYREAYSRVLERISVLESARDTIAQSMVGEDFEPVHLRMAQLVKDRQAIADGIEKIVYWGDLMVQECHDAQKALHGLCEQACAAAMEFLDADQPARAQAEVVLARSAVEELITTKEVPLVEDWGGRMAAAMPTVIPATWGTAAAPQGAAAPASSDPSIQETGYDPLKQAGGADGPGPGRADPTSTSENAQPNSGDSPASNGDGEGKKGHPDPNAHQGANSGAGQRGNDGHPGPGEAQPTAKNGAASPASSSPLPTSGLGALPSPSGAGGGGMGSSTSGLGGLPGMGGGVKPPGLEGSPSAGGVGAPRSPMLSPPSGAGTAGAGSGGGSGVPRIPQAPSAPVTEVSAAPPVSASPSAAPSASAGTFSANPAAVQPLSSAASAGSGGVASSAAAAGPVGMAPIGGGASVAPPPAQVGAAPTASPGLSQGAIGPAGSAAAASGASPAAAAGMGVVPASFSEDGPSTVNAHAQLAVNTVKALIPGVTGYPGMAVAAAVVRAAGGVPQVVMTTNEGAGYLPAGCFLPHGVLHAFAELDSEEFDLKWMGWVDPARTLIDYVETYKHCGDPMELLGLASSVAVSDEVKALFPQVVPKVAPDPGAKPLGPERGRNRHRLQVLAAPFYDELVRKSERVRFAVAAAATVAVMAERVAKPFASEGSPPMRLINGEDLPPEEWAVLREEYDQRVRVVGSVRPGFLTGGRDDQMIVRYQEMFRQLRVMETAMNWAVLPDISVADIVYAAHQAGVDINPLFSVAEQRAG